MICNNCGCFNPDGQGHCQSCGRPLAPPPVYPQPPAGPYLAPEPPAVQALRRFGGSGLLLALAILFSVHSLFAGISAIFNSSYAINGHTYASTQNIFSIAISGLLGAAVPALFAAGFWIFYANSKNHSKPLRDGGLKLLKVMVVIQQIAGWLLIACLGLILFCLFLLALMGELAGLEQNLRYGNFLSIRNSLAGVIPQLLSRDGAVAGAIVLLLLLLFLISVLTLLIVFTFKLLRAIRSIQYTVQTGKPLDDSPGSAIVISYILAGVSALGVVCGGWYIPSALIGAAVYTLLGLLLSRYRSEMRWLMSSRDPAVAQGYFTYAYQPTFQPALTPQGFQPGAMPVEHGDIMGYCSRCGGPLWENDRICAYCGWPR